MLRTRRCILCSEGTTLKVMISFNARGFYGCPQGVVFSVKSTAALIILWAHFMFMKLLSWENSKIIQFNWALSFLTSRRKKWPCQGCTDRITSSRGRGDFGSGDRGGLRVTCICLIDSLTLSAKVPTCLQASRKHFCSGRASLLPTGKKKLKTNTRNFARPWKTIVRWLMKTSTSMDMFKIRFLIICPPS